MLPPRPARRHRPLRRERRIPHLRLRRPRVPPPHPHGKRRSRRARRLCLCGRKTKEVAPTKALLQVSPNISTESCTSYFAARCTPARNSSFTVATKCREEAGIGAAPLRIVL